MTTPAPPPPDAGPPADVPPADWPPQPLYASEPAEPAPPARRWLIVITVVWVLVLAGAALWHVRRGGPTDREQTTIGAAKVTTDRLAADAVAAAGPGAVVDVGGFEDRGSCRITVARGGVQHAREINLYAPVGGEAALLDAMAAGLPQAYRAEVSGQPNTRRLRADGGNYVALTGTVVGPGQVRVVIDTGCRQDAGDLAEPTDPPIEARAAVTDVLTVLGSPTVTWRSTALPCANGTTLWTVTATGPANGAALDTSLAKLAASPVLAEHARVAWRTGGLSRWATSGDDGIVTVGATTSC
jgi:hypothetical protein